MRRTPVVAATLALSLSGVLATTAAHADVTDVVAGTVVGGLLTMTGVGANVAVSGQPGELTDTVGAAALTVSDLRLTTAGWAVTATYSDPPAGAAKPFGAANVLVSATSVTGDILGSALTLATDQPLTSPVTVASTGTGTGAGVTVVTSGYKVRIPADATLADTYAATVTYTVASIR